MESNMDLSDLISVTVGLMLTMQFGAEEDKDCLGNNLRERRKVYGLDIYNP
jgi:hypothetical protein